LAASQPGFTIVDPLVASLLGVFIFQEHLQLAPLAIVVEAAALGALVAGVVAISRSQLVQGQTHEDEAGLRPMPAALDVRDASG
jgi:glucose uptake protein GlcU